MSLAERSRPAVFSRSGFESAEGSREMETKHQETRSPRGIVSKRGRGAMLRAENTFRLP
jgi:hypothetical protein